LSNVPVTRALLSVYDKTGLIPLARRLVAAGVELVSSGGTAAALVAAGLPVTPVEDVTNAPEMLGGRVKTLHPIIHGAILADRGNPSHLADLDERGIRPFELVVVNLYPFRETIARPGVTRQMAIENIDIGGPTMVRAAAKNHAWVGVVTSAGQYEIVARAVEQGGLGDELRVELAKEAFFHTAAYDAAIVGWLESGEALPQRSVVAARRHATLRYGENPHQQAAAYLEEGASAWWSTARQLQGKEMSFNNYVDANAAWRHVQEFGDPACVVVKHTNACGVAEAGSLEEAFRFAWAGDPQAAFGSVIAVNRPLDLATTRSMLDAGFIEVVVAPGVDDAVGEAVAAKANLRVLVVDPPDTVDLDRKRIQSGFLAQQWDAVALDDGWEVVSARQPTEAEWADLRFAWKVAAHTKSNAIVIGKAGQAVGIGAGDQSRVGASERAVAQAGDRAVGAVAASDAFFPFRDGIDTLAAVGVTAIIEPGGSVRDAEVIAACDEHGVAMVFTGRRHFTH